MKMMFAKLASMVAGGSLLAETSPSPFNTLMDTFGGGFAEFVNFILGGVITLVYLIFKWILVVIDFCFILVRQLVGINTDFSSFQNIIDNDVIFQFIFSENVVSVITALFWLGIVLILVFAIIAIIKSDFSAMAEMDPSGEIKNQKGKIWKSIGESILLLILVPLVLFGSIIMSNAVLAGLYNATGFGSDISLGGQIFMASSYSANSYRWYANSNKKIPITYSFKQVSDYSAVTTFDDSGTMQQVVDNLTELKKQSVLTQGMTTHLMFYNNAFFDMTSIDYMQQMYTENDYNNIYDQNIYTYRYEYYVNADLVDYMMRSGNTIYIMNLQEIYQSYVAAGINPTIGFEGPAEAPTAYTISVKYLDGSTSRVYSHVANTNDESDGSVYVACIKSSNTLDGRQVTYWQPLTNRNSAFSSEYLDDGQFIVLRGVFDEGRYPTAIKKSNGIVSYYRDEVQVPTFLSFFPHISYELPAGSTQDGVQKAITKAIDLITGVNINDFIPYIYWDIDMLNLYTKGTYTIASLRDTNPEGGAGIRLDYSFSMAGTNLDLFYFKLNINIVILIIAGGAILGRMVACMFGAMRRFVDLMFLYIMYPAAVSTIPLFGKSSLGRWIKQVAQKLFSAYGLILGLNLGLALVSISDQIILITPQMMEETILSFLPNEFTATCINYLIQVLFTLVGINFIFYVGKVIGFLIFDEAKTPAKASSLDTMGDEVIKGTKGVFEAAGKVISGKALLGTIDGLKNWVPGMAIIDDVKQRVGFHKTSFGLAKQMGEELAANSATLNGGGGEGGGGAAAAAKGAASAGAAGAAADIDLGASGGGEAPAPSGDGGGGGGSLPSGGSGGGSGLPEGVADDEEDNSNDAANNQEPERSNTPPAPAPEPITLPEMPEEQEAQPTQETPESSQEHKPTDKPKQPASKPAEEARPKQNISMDDIVGRVQTTSVPAHEDEQPEYLKLKDEKSFRDKHIKNQLYNKYRDKLLAEGNDPEETAKDGTNVLNSTARIMAEHEIMNRYGSDWQRQWVNNIDKSLAQQGLDYSVAAKDENKWSEICQLAGDMARKHFGQTDNN